MAVQIETRGQLQEFLEILRRRMWQVILPAAFAITLGTAYAVLVPKKYLVLTQIELRPVGMSVSSKEGSNAPFQIPAHERVKKVVQGLKNPNYLALPPEERDDYLRDIEKSIKVTLGKGANEFTNFVNISYVDPERQWAVDFLHALRDDWIQDVLERDRNKLEDEKEKLLQEKTKLEKQYAFEEQGLTDLRREHNISPTQPIPGGVDSRLEDPVYSRLIANQQLLDRTGLDIAKLQAKIDELAKQYAEAPQHLTREDVVAGQSNTAELRDTEVKIVQAQDQIKGYKPEHHKFRQLQEQIASLQDKHDELERLVTRNALQTVEVQNPVRQELQKEIAAQNTEIKTLQATQKNLQASIDRDERNSNELQNVYKEIRERSAKIEILRSAMGDTERRYQDKTQQVQILRSPLSNPFVITQEIGYPSRPTEPNPLLIIAFSILAGLALGIGLAVTLEYSKNCFRSVSDISRVMVVPVLGAINTISTHREQRLRRIKRLLIGASSVVLIGSVLFITWAWSADRELLSQDLIVKIEALRSKFK